MTVKIGTHDVDLTKALPIVLRDIKALSAKGVDLLKMQELNADQLITFVHHIAAKAKPDITEDDVLDTPLQVIQEVATFVQEVDKDFLASSTASVESTAGTSSKSKH